MKDFVFQSKVQLRLSLIRLKKLKLFFFGRTEKMSVHILLML